METLGKRQVQGQIALHSSERGRRRLILKEGAVMEPQNRVGNEWVIQV
jgi:hypothetical protein